MRIKVVPVEILVVPGVLTLTDSAQVINSPRFGKPERGQTKSGRQSDKYFDKFKISKPFLGF